jgi:hypothetical protein
MNGDITATERSPPHPPSNPSDWSPVNPNTTTAGFHARFDVAVDELRDLSALMSLFAETDERNPLAHVLVSSNQGRRVWLMGDGTTYAALRSTDPARDHDVMLPRRLIDFAATGTEDVEFIVGTDHAGQRTASVSVDSTAFTTELVHEIDQRLYQVLDIPDEIAATATVDARSLSALLQIASAAPTEYEPGDAPLFWIEADHGRLTIDITWEHLGESVYEVRGSGTGRARTAGVPMALRHAFLVLEGDVEIRFTAHPDGPITLIGADRVIRTWPVATTCERLRGHVEELLGDAFGSMSLHRDADGDYPLRRHGIPIYARLVDGPPVSVQIFGVLLDDVEPSDALMRELNELNGSVSHARILCVGRQVLAEADLVAHTLDTDELLTSARSIARIANELVPPLAAFYGGTAPDPEQARWADYRTTMIKAELWPGEEHLVSGPSAFTDWRLPDDVFVLTAWNPQGVLRSRHDNDRATDTMAAEIIARGGAFVRALGFSEDGYSEPGFLVWNLDREDAVALGRTFQQDAIFAVTADEVSLISCRDDRTESWPRIWPT